MAYINTYGGMSAKPQGLSIADKSEKTFKSILNNSGIGFEKSRKMLATKFALAELRLNRFDSKELDYRDIYETVYLEKFMFIEATYNIAQINKLTKKIATNQEKLIADVGLIVKNTGEILENQHVIITQIGEIKVVLDDVKNSVDYITDVVDRIDETTQDTNVVVKDIQTSVDDMRSNGITVTDLRAKPSGYASSGVNTKLLFGVLAVAGIGFYFMNKK